MPPAQRQRKPAPKKGAFARLKERASQGRPPLDPYVMDDVEPPISIDPPSSIEQQVELAQLFNNSGDFHMRDARHILEVICGDQFPRVWELLRREHISVLIAFIRELADHFSDSLASAAEEDFPGGSGASSS